ncbi:RNA polymerase II-associated protein 3 isoform X2 [Plutella xylostella]|nr:RNA polymerase II-associated protein 3 isoform X2 [Plutella xylostella]
MEDVGPTSLDGKKSLSVKQEKLREEAQYEKERGNAFVKQEKWDDAITCYNRAIELVTDDAIYYANRGLCHLKKDSLHQAEKDCTEALRLDPTYVKALQRRATAREKLGSLRAASHDLNQVLTLEPHNAAARNQLRAIKARMGTKGTKSKSSPVSTPTSENKSMLAAVQPKIIELEDDVKPAPVAKAEVKTEQPPKLSSDEKWINGVGENVNVIKPVKKPPHLRSKRGLKPIPIQEIQLGKSEPEKPPTRLKIIEIEDSQAKGDTNNNKSDTNKIDTIINSIEIKKEDVKVESKKMNGLSPESEKLNIDCLVNEKNDVVRKLVPPVNSVQFMTEWKNLKNTKNGRIEYLNLIDPARLPAILGNALESDLLSELLLTLHACGARVTSHLRGLARVRRLSALAMFLSERDKELIHKLLVHCKTVEGCDDDTIADLKNKFEL